MKFCKILDSHPFLSQAETGLSLLWPKCSYTGLKLKNKKIELLSGSTLCHNYPGFVLCGEIVGKCLTEEQEILSRWTEYCSELYNYESYSDNTGLQSAPRISTANPS